MTDRPPSLDRPGTLLALPDWESDLPERLVSAFVALSRSTPAMLRLGVPIDRPDGSDYEGRVISQLMACGINPSLDPLELELFDAPGNPTALAALLADAPLVWAPEDSPVAEAARGLGRYVTRTLDVDRLEWDLWLSQPLDAAALACYRPEEVADFCQDPEALRIVRVRLDRLPWGGFNACLFCHHLGSDRFMAWYFVEVLGRDGDKAVVRLPDYMKLLPLAVVERLERVLETVLATIEANPENTHVVSMDIQNGTDTSLPPTDHTEGVGLLQERHVPYAKRYWLAQSACHGRDVLDLHPEAGYGSRMLSLVARRVTALATSAPSAAYGNMVYGAPGLEFRPWQGADLPCADGTFDVVTDLGGLAGQSWESLDPYFDEIRRVLRPSGELIISLSNPDVPKADHEPIGDVRLRGAEFEALLRGHFESVLLYGQCPSRQGGFDLAREHAIVPGHDQRQTCFIAVCRSPRPDRAPVRLEKRPNGLRLLSLGGPEAILDLLRQTGHELLVANTPEEAHEHLQTRPIDLILGHAPRDLEVLTTLALPSLYLLHAEAPPPDQATLQAFVAARRGCCAAFSPALLVPNGVTGLILPFALDDASPAGRLHRLVQWEEAFVAAREVDQTRRQLDALYLRMPEAPRSERPPRILMASVSSAFSTSAYFARAFRQEGCEVLTVGPMLQPRELSAIKTTTDQHALKETGSADRKVDLLSRLTKPCDIPWQPGQADVRDILKALPAGWSPDLFIWVDSYTTFMPYGFEHLPCPAVCFIGDSHQRMDWRIDYAKQFDHVFIMFNRHHIPHFERAGCRNVGWLPAACDPDVHIWTAAEKAYDVGFIGQTLRQWYPDRVRLLERLMAVGIDVHVESQILQEMALVFNRSRIVFNRSIREDLNMRVFEALATGSMLLTNRLPTEAGQDLLFKDREHLVIYDEDNLEALASYYLTHEDEREAIAARGRAEVLAHHTYRHRARQVLAAVGERCGAPAAIPTK